MKPVDVIWTDSFHRRWDSHKNVRQHFHPLVFLRLHLPGWVMIRTQGKFNDFCSGHEEDEVVVNLPFF